MELVITDYGAHLGRSGERLVVRRNDQPPVEMPAADVASILLAGKGMSVSSDAIALAIEHGAGITFISYCGEPYAKVVAPDAFGQARLRREQLRALDDARGVALAASFITGKLRNQASNLRYFAKSRKTSAPEVHAQLHAHADAIDARLPEPDPGDGARLDTARTALMADEALAAKEYWRGVGFILPEEAGFPGRVRRGATDPFNASLNYGYGILYTRIWSVLITVGLDPYVGYIHTLQDGKPGLVFDFIEEFRAYVVDRPLLAAFSKRWRPNFDEDGALDQASRKAIAARVLEQTQGRVHFEGKSVRMDDVMIAGAREVAAAMRGGPPRKAYVAEW